MMSLKTCQLEFGHIKRLFEITIGGLKSPGCCNTSKHWISFWSNVIFNCCSSSSSWTISKVIYTGFVRYQQLHVVSSTMYTPQHHDDRYPIVFVEIYVTSVSIQYIFCNVTVSSVHQEFVYSQQCRSSFVLKFELSDGLC